MIQQGTARKFLFAFLKQRRKHYMSADIANCWWITCVTNVKVDKRKWANFTGNCLRRDTLLILKCLDEVVICLSPYA